MVFQKRNISTCISWNSTKRKLQIREGFSQIHSFRIVHLFISQSVLLNLNRQRGFLFHFYKIASLIIPLLKFFRSYYSAPLFLIAVYALQRSFTTSPAMISPTTDGTNATLPGMSRRSVHLCAAPGGQMQWVRQLMDISSIGLVGTSSE